MEPLFKCLLEKNKQVIFTNLTKPKSFFKRNNGLMFKDRLKKDEALMITGCNCIHTFFMKFSIDVIYLNKNLEIKKIKKNIKPFRLTLPVWSARSVIECTTGNHKVNELQVGDRLIVCP